jgi:hypothetical protein
MEFLNSSNEIFLQKSNTCHQRPWIEIMYQIARIRKLTDYPIYKLYLQVN